MKLSTKSQYALEGLLYMAVEDRGTISVKELGEQTGTSSAYIEQIFFKLKHAGLVQTVRGAKGGFNLKRVAEQITVGDIIRAVEGAFVPVKCVEDLSACKSKTRSVCVSRRVWVRVSNSMVSAADGITLGALRDGYRAEKNGGGQA